MLMAYSYISSDILSISIYSQYIFMLYNEPLRGNTAPVLPLPVVYCTEWLWNSDSHPLV